MHLTHKKIRQTRVNPEDVFSPVHNKFILDADGNGEQDLDSFFFYSVPTSYFVLDERIPSILRELFAEAAGCLKGNFLTGGSACARKLIYEFAMLQGASGKNYSEHLKSLKQRTAGEAQEFVDALLEILRVTSEKVHEKSHDEWDSKYLRAILQVLDDLLWEIYVVPDDRKERYENVRRIREELVDSDTGMGDIEQQQAKSTS